MESGNYKQAANSLGKIRYLDVTPPPVYNYFYGKCLYESKQYQEGLKYITKYLNEEGREGEFYQESLKIYSKIEAYEKSKIVCSRCNGKKVCREKYHKKCPACYGRGKVKKEVYNCRGNTFEYWDCYGARVITKFDVGPDRIRSTSQGGCAGKMRYHGEKSYDDFKKIDGVQIEDCIKGEAYIYKENMKCTKCDGKGFHF